MIKYKLGDLAKDLNMPANDIAALIKDRFNAVKKPGTVLTDEELNYVFEKVTAEKGVKSFESYFASKSAPKQEKKDKPEKTEKFEKKDKPEKTDRPEKKDKFEKKDK